MPHATVQATEPKYELHSLGWKAFQHLCVSIAGVMWGQVVQGFLDTKDGGRDGAFYGKWSPTTGESFEGAFTAQCKFSSDSTKTLQLSDLKDELEKAKRLAARGLADNYILFTTARLTGKSDEKIRAAFESVPGIKRFAAYGSDRISQFIRESPRLRMLVPRVYGLGDLGQILDERAYDQAREILSALGDDLAKFVITDAYQRSAQALVEHGFVLLLGEPACGKSTIAAALALGALDEWGCFTLKIRDADEFVAHSNPHEQKQFFWVDDAFGATQFDWQAASRWNTAFPHMHAAIRRGARIVFTSRDYIYRSARSALKESALPIIRESQVVIRVETLTKEEREQILYNHIRLGDQPKSFKGQVKPFLPEVASHQRFTPEIARRLGNRAFTKKLKISPVGLEEFVAQPMEMLQEIIRTLDAHSRSAIALVFMRGGVLPSPATLAPEEEQALRMLGGSAPDVRNSLNALDGSLLIQVQQGGEFSWRFKHPTVRDAFAGLLAQDRELMDIYLRGTPIEKLFFEISCGKVDFEGVKVVVPEDRFDLVLSRLEVFGQNRRNRDEINRFLARRCDRKFLALYLTRNSDFVASLQMGSYFYAVSDVDIILQLHRFGLLPETERKRHIATIRTLAVDVPDAGFLNERFRDFITPDELDATLEAVRSRLLLDIDACIDSWTSNHDGETEPDVYFDHLVDALRDYEGAFAENGEALICIKRGLTLIEKAIDSLRDDMPGEPDFDYHSERGQRSESSGSRSVFDDVDQ